MPSESLIEIYPIALQHTRCGTGIFFKERTGGDKVAVMFIHLHEGMLLEDAFAKKGPPRPLTHDLLCGVLEGIEAQDTQIVIKHKEGSYFTATLTLRIYNEVMKKIIELDARPSDALIIATKRALAVHIRESTWQQLEDVAYQLDHVPVENQDAQAPIFFT